MCTYLSIYSDLVHRLTGFPWVLLWMVAMVEVGVLWVGSEVWAGGVGWWVWSVGWVGDGVGPRD